LVKNQAQLSPYFFVHLSFSHAFPWSTTKHSSIVFNELLLLRQEGLSFCLELPEFEKIMSDLVLTHLINLLSGSALPYFILIIASWRVARLRQLSMENYEDRVQDTVAETIKEQLCDKVLEPLFATQNLIVPHGHTLYSIFDEMLPNNDISLLSTMYNDIAQFGVSSPSFIEFLQFINSMGGGG
jgi:hypothetical protein